MTPPVLSPTPPSAASRLLPFARSTTTLQATTYLLGISLFSISFLVFLNSGVSFVVTDLIGRKSGVGDVVGTLGFADELVALVACPAWGLLSDRLGVRWVAVCGYGIIALALVVFVQARSVYPGLLLARVLFAVGATAAATMVTAILPSLTNESHPDEEERGRRLAPKPTSTNARDSVALSVDSESTITPERYIRTLSNGEVVEVHHCSATLQQASRPSVLAGYVGLFTGCGALVALVCFLPLPAKFGEIDGVTPGEAVSYSFYVVAAVALLVAVFVSVGLRGLKGEDGKGWKMLLGMRKAGADAGEHGTDHPTSEKAALPYLHLLRDSITLGFSDSNIALGYLGGFVARASAVAISLFIPLFVNTYFISNGFCHGSPNDPSPELKKECRAAYVLSSILTGVAQLMALMCAPVFGYVSSRSTGFHYPVVVSTTFGIVGYLLFPRLSSPEFKDNEGRGGSPVVFLAVSLVGISQIGAIVCSLGSLGRGVLTADLTRAPAELPSGENGEADESAPLLERRAPDEATSRVRLKGSIAGVYSWCGGAAILLLTKLGGYLFDSLSTASPFYMMAIFNGILLTATIAIDISRKIRTRA